MKKNVFRKSLVIGIIILFLGAGVVSGVYNSVKKGDGINRIENLGGPILTFDPTDDCYIKHNKPDNTGGAHPYMSIRNEYGGGGSPGWAWDGLIKFDISSIPPETYINSATLNLFYYHYTDTNPVGRPLNLTRATSNWNEDTVTWNTQPSYASQPTTFANVPSSIGVWMTWDVTTDVRDFVDETLTNYGWKITDENYWGNSDIPTTDFRTKEHGSVTPYLTVELIDEYAPECSIRRPLKGWLYINDEEIEYKGKTQIIGNKFTFWVEVTDDSAVPEGIERVDFYVYDEFLASVGKKAWDNHSKVFKYKWEDVPQYPNGCRLEVKVKDESGKWSGFSSIVFNPRSRGLVQNELPIVPKIFKYYLNLFPILKLLIQQLGL